MRRFDTVFRNVRVYETTINFPSVGSNGSISVNVATAVGAAPLGTEILGFTPITDASSIDDMIMQVFVPLADTIRFTLQNPSGGPIDPAAIDFRIVTGFVNPDLVEAI